MTDVAKQLWETIKVLGLSNDKLALSAIRNALSSSQQRETQEASKAEGECPGCGGLGRIRVLRCEQCDGTGKISAPTSKEAGKAEKCKTCNGHGLIGGFVSDGDGGGGYDSEPCPECNSKEAGKVEAVADEREAFEHWWRLAPEGDTPLSDVHTERDRRLALLAWRARASLYLRPSQQALGEEQISEWALRMFEMDAIDIEIELRRILAAAGGSEK